MSRELQPCGTYAAYMRHLRAGESPCEPCRTANRERQKGRPPRSRELQPCGTRAAYTRHLRRGEDPCEPCRVANRVRGREADRRYEERQRARRRARALQPVVVPRVVQGPEGVGPCAVPANGFLWDPVREDETPSQARDRQRVAAAVCRTQCAVFAWCKAEAPRVGGVVAGVVS